MDRRSGSAEILFGVHQETPFPRCDAPDRVGVGVVLTGNLLHGLPLHVVVTAKEPVGPGRHSTVLEPGRSGDEQRRRLPFRHRIANTLQVSLKVSERNAGDPLAFNLSPDSFQQAEKTGSPLQRNLRRVGKAALARPVIIPAEIDADYVRFPALQPSQKPSSLKAAVSRYRSVHGLEDPAREAPGKLPLHDLRVDGIAEEGAGVSEEQDPERAGRFRERELPPAAKALAVGEFGPGDGRPEKLRISLEQADPDRLSLLQESVLVVGWNARRVRRRVNSPRIATAVMARRTASRGKSQLRCGIHRPCPRRGAAEVWWRSNESLPSKRGLAPAA